MNLRFLACETTGWRVHAYVLMSNHYHLLMETPEANLVAGMKWLQGAYTQRYNSRHNLRGHLAWCLRQGTTVSLRWVSERLGMGHYTRVTQAISRIKRRPGRKHELFRRKLDRLE